MPKLDSDTKTLFLLAGVALALGLIVGVITEQRSILIRRGDVDPVSTDNHSQKNFRTSNLSAIKNNLSGIECGSYSRRPIAVMIAEDEEARPLSGIGSADLVIEMPVVVGSVTRMMAFFVCEDPREIGSVRSARHDFITLAKGYDAIFAHWGGSSFAQEELATGSIDNLDALPNFFDAFYRKKWIPAPHNGFTSMRRLVYAAQSLDYRLVSEFEGYSLLDDEWIGIGNKEGASKRSLKIGYKHPYNVRYEYNPLTNIYYRWRGEGEEIDQLENKQVNVKNIVVMKTKSRELEGWYNDVDVLGMGEAWVYRNGEEIEAIWKKETTESVLRFYNKDNQEIKFVPGRIWINIVEIDTTIDYK